MALVASSLAVASLRLIIDTDIGGGGCNDVDDVVAVSIAHALADRGEVELLAVVQNTAPLECAGVISVLNHFWGRGNLSVGAYNISTPGATLQQQPPLSYVPAVARHFDSRIKLSTQAEDAVAVYRRALAQSPDGSVAISSIGIHTNLAALLRSGPDGHSALRGRELVARKVATLAVMGGAYPKGGECNLQGGGDQGFGLHNHYVASAASGYVASNWPSSSRLIWSGAEVGAGVQSGGAGFQKRCPAVADPTTNPCAVAMIAYEGGPDRSRYSWDPLTTLVAVRGTELGYVSACTGCDGVNVVNPKDGTNAWKPGGPSNQTYLVLHDGAQAGAALDELLCQRSKLNPHPSKIHPAPPPPAPPAPPGLCLCNATAAAGAGPAMTRFGGGDYTKAWDGDVTTFYDFSNADGGWTQAKLQPAAAVAMILFYPRAGFLSRHVQGGSFVGRTADGAEVPLGTIARVPLLAWNAVQMQGAAATPVTSVRFNAASGSWGNIAEIAVYTKC